MWLWPAKCSTGLEREWSLLWQMCLGLTEPRGWTMSKVAKRVTQTGEDRMRRKESCLGNVTCLTSHSEMGMEPLCSFLLMLEWGMMIVR